MQIKLSLECNSEITKEDLYYTTQQLRNELLETKVDNVEFQKSNDAVKNTKSVDAVSINELLLTLVASGGIITTLINVLHSWLIRNKEHSITLEINGDKLEIKGVTSFEKKRLIDEWLARNSLKDINNE